MLNRAAMLGLYKNVLVHDANTQLPFEDKSFSTIFSNILYWLNNVENVLAELKRVLRDDGKIAVMLPDEFFYSSSFAVKRGLSKDAPKWIKMIDRGIFSDNVKHALNLQGWRNVFERCGLSVMDHQTHLSATLISIWSVGFRPMFPVLNRMVTAIPSTELPAIKEEWVSILMEFAIPLCFEEIERIHRGEGCFHFFVLGK